ncbi:hypothetical protein GUITHDRAFT_94185 [Guillardia theta CCMP2712]|uniref:Large ribosomal subunit protein bL28c n=2 Tax=Guillardia theta TaxID=55529 RepID=L1JEM8_GUITC|nr:hypothetical protein GUITHDRAFT_94185 [Guillardia theta CCMP2712]EKX46988.1 hypothetical protein GUITHDRAFT_94185 [Guillardia theta CCMP2712]|eukprot:XP_005833968.1 hypothetical protein GUITHDRAFT_94185 [Guillardia theta CCMP2712]
MLRSCLLLAAAAAASAFTVPVSVTTSVRPATLAKADSSFVATKRSLPVFAESKRHNALEALQMSCTTERSKQMPCRKECMLLGKRANNKMTVSFSHRRHHKLQNVNLQWKRIWWEEGNSFVRLRVSTKAIKTLKTKPIQELAARVGLNLNDYRSG